jgi:hypothetical protein
MTVGTSCGAGGTEVLEGWFEIGMAKRKMTLPAIYLSTSS